MTLPLVSAIIPVHNGEPYLPAALRSIFTQDYRPLEVIVVDDGSTDGTAAVARSFPDVRFLTQPNRGVAVARNAGLDAAQGEFIAFLDQDDLWTPGKLTAQVTQLLEHPEVGYCVAHVRHFLESGTAAPRWLKPELLTQEVPGLYPGNLVARRSAFARVGRFDSTYQMASDSDWYARAKDCGLPMAIHPETLLLKRIHGVNHSHQTKQATVNFWRA